MKKMTQVACLSAISIALLSGCASQPATPPAASSNSAGIPDWVLAPADPVGGMASTGCAPDTNSMNLNRSQATAAARADLTKRISVKVQAMDKLYGRTAEVDGQSESAGTFESVSKQLAEQALSGTRVAKADYVDINGRRNLCAMVVLEPDATKALVDKIIKQSNRAMSPDKEAVLYEEFRAAKAQSEMAEAFSR